MLYIQFVRCSSHYYLYFDIIDIIIKKIPNTTQALAAINMDNLNVLFSF